MPTLVPGVRAELTSAFSGALLEQGGPLLATVLRRIVEDAAVGLYSAPLEPYSDFLFLNWGVSLASDTDPDRDWELLGYRVEDDRVSTTFGRLEPFSP